MPNTREKLIKLLSNAHSISTEAACFDDATYAKQLRIEADHLIANGVTIPVRCKECKYINREIHAKGYGCLCDAHSCDREGHERYLYVEDDDFCSYGERREGE